MVGGGPPRVELEGVVHEGGEGAEERGGRVGELLEEKASRGRHRGAVGGGDGGGDGLGPVRLPCARLEEGGVQHSLW